MSDPTIITRLTIWFDPPFWVGVYEVEQDGRLWAGRHVFGAEPSGEEVYRFVLSDLGTLRAHMTHAVPAAMSGGRPLSFKRMQREIRRSAQGDGIQTKSQAALKEHLAANKIERKKVSREERDAQELHRRAAAREKARARHRGRG